jgi:glycosyltransferase involved in cell wall biosynthesis
MDNRENNLLLVANWDSGTEYAWWLMESFWLLLGQNHSGSGKEVHLTYPSVSTVPMKISQSEIQIHQLDFKRNDLISLYKQCKFIRQKLIGTIYFTDYPSYSIKYLLFRLIGVSYIITHEHVPGTRSQPTGVKSLFKKTIHGTPLVCASGLIATTEYVRHRLISITCMPEEKCFCAPNGLPARKNIQPADLRKLHGIPIDRKIMVTTGRASKYKGIDFALVVIGNLINTQKRKDIHYIFCGDGPDLESFQTTAKNLGICEYVTFTGQLTSVPQYLEACDIAIHPSKGEVGYSLSILEYMQAGLPVVVPDNPSVCGATIDGVTGYIYRENNIEDAADKIALFLDSPKSILIMGEQAKTEVSQNYQLSNTHTELLKAFTTITKKKKSID